MASYVNVRVDGCSVSEIWKRKSVQKNNEMCGRNQFQPAETKLVNRRTGRGVEMLYGIKSLKIFKCEIN